MIYETLEVSLNEKLLEILYRLDCVDNIITFNNYYQYGQNIMRLNQCFPYIFNEGKVHWNIMIWIVFDSVHDSILILKIFNAVDISLKYK